MRLGQPCPHLYRDVWRGGGQPVLVEFKFQVFAVGGLGFEFASVGGMLFGVGGIF